MANKKNSDSDTVLRPGQNCWRRERARNVGICVDGEEYFAAVRQSMKAAQERICILGWEFHSQMLLTAGSADDGLPDELGPFLNAILEKSERLEIYVLIWDYSMIYLQEREWRLFSDWMNNPHPRLRFASDTTAPTGASHHQKVVTIDDQLAFCGGLDLSITRWDTTEHRVDDERRVAPNGDPYDPFHDVHAVVDGEGPVRAFCDLFRERWERAAEDKLLTLSGEKASSENLWPKGVAKSFENVEVGISRITASPESRPTEIESLHCDLFKAAEKLIFIENQYLSSLALSRVIEERLREPEGPEVIMILPRETSGWLVESTMGLLRDRLLERLHEADVHDRFRAVAPEVENKEGKTQQVYVHAKALVIDDRILKVGSSNLCNRSMRMDSECDMTIELREPHESIIRLRHRLLGIHCGLSEEEWKAREGDEGLLPLIDRLEGEGKERDHRLRSLPYGCHSKLKRWLSETQLLDPVDPIDPEFLILKNLSDEERPAVWRRILILSSLLLAGVVLGLWAHWGWSEIYSREEAIAFWENASGSVWLPAIIVAAFAVGGTIGVPLNFMLVTMVVVLEFSSVVLYGIGGALLSSCLGFFMGRKLGKPLIRKINSRSVESVSDKLGERSFRSVAFIRLVPVAPFFMINLVAGASKLKFSQYIVGTLLGMAPGMGLVIFLASSAKAAARSQTVGSFVVLGLALVFVVGLVAYFRKTLFSRS